MSCPRRTVPLSKTANARSSRRFRSTSWQLLRFSSAASATRRRSSSPCFKTTSPPPTPPPRRRQRCTTRSSPRKRSVATRMIPLLDRIPDLHPQSVQGCEHHLGLRLCPPEADCAPGGRQGRRSDQGRGDAEGSSHHGCEAEEERDGNDDRCGGGGSRCDDGCSAARGGDQARAVNSRQDAKRRVPCDDAGPSAAAPVKRGADRSPPPRRPAKSTGIRDAEVVVAPNAGGVP